MSKERVILMEILQIKYFMKVAANESIAQTAAIFQVPSSSVSISIKRLEKELGMTLFNRGAHSIRLNRNGQILLLALERANEEFEKVTAEFQSIPQIISGNIKILVLTNEKIMLDIIRKYKLRYPDINVQIQHSDYLEYGKYSLFDIVITDREITDERFKKESFINEEVFLAVSPSHSLSNHKIITFDQIRDEKFVCAHRGESLRSILDQIFKKNALKPKISIGTEDPYEICEYVKSGLGITFFPYISWRSQIDERIRLIRYGNGIHRNSYIYSKKECTPAVDLFLNTFKLSMNQ